MLHGIIACVPVLRALINLRNLAGVRRKGNCSYLVIHIVVFIVIFASDKRKEGQRELTYILLTLSVLGRVFIFTLLIIYRFCTASETHVGVRIIQILTIDLLTSIDPS